MQPKHIGVILDGNRRFAKKLMMQPWKGHEWGAKKFREFTEWCFNKGVEEITAYVFSIQNFNRPKEEFDFIMKIFKEEFEHLLKTQDDLKEKGIAIKFVGKQSMLPKEIQELENKVAEATKNNKKRRINFALAYGGREELTDAMVRIAEKVKKGTIKPEQINEETIRKELWLETEPELIIRTGGEKRTSNFLPWQSTYSEWIYLDKFWPEITEEDLKKCIEEYNSRERRFGK